jgi:hypothetical protein
MKKFIVAGLVVAGLGILAPAYSVTVSDPTPNGTFSDSDGNQGYVSADETGVRACNENDATPAGDGATGYIWVNPNGEDTTPTYGNEFVGAGDRDGENDGNPNNGTESHDCP